MKDNSVRVYCLRFKGVESLCPPSQTFKWCEGGWGGVVSERKVKIQIVWLSNCSVNARPIVALMFLFSIVSYLSISTITLWLVYYLKQHFTKWQVFVRFSSNFNLIDRLSKSYSKAIWWNFEKLSMVSSFSVWIL